MIDRPRRELLRYACVAGIVAMSPFSSAIGAACTVLGKDGKPQDDTGLFIAVSSVLTGIDPAFLVPKVDPFPVQVAYFAKASSHPSFSKLMAAARSSASGSCAAVAAAIMHNADPNVVLLARSIILLWYLGAWYEPSALASRIASSGKGAAPDPQILMVSSYIQSWIWRAAQAHPPGYSTGEFGHWHDTPPALAGFLPAGGNS